MRIRLRLTALTLAAVLALAACGETPPPWSGSGSPSAGIPSALPSATAAVSAASPTPAASATPAPSASASPLPPASPGPSASPVPGGWSHVGTKPCPDSEFTCITLAVPRDHFAAGGPTWDTTFAIHRAGGNKVGTFVVITGGPGSSGILAADSYTSYFPAPIVDRFDIVFLDQRGVGQSKPLACPKATEAFYATDGPDGSAAVDAAYAAAAKTYAADCVRESGADPADMPFYSTRQAVEDLEAVREYLGVPKLHLYGESYGTQYAQTYAASHPDRIATLYLDGPVDLTVDAATYYGEASRTFNDTFIASANACRLDPSCRSDLAGADPVAAYDALVAKARAGALRFDFPMADGKTQSRSMSRADIETATVGYLYSPGDRELLLRALIAADRGNLVPLARLAYASLLVDPDTLVVKPDPSYSDAMYYAVECQDYVYNAGAGSEADRVASFLATGRAMGPLEGRFGGVYYSDMPCLFWPNTPTADPRPAPIVNAPYPTVVMVATTDPITPVENAIRIANRLTKATVILQTGGPHVIFGCGRSCPDDLVADYMVKGTPFKGPVVTCPGSVVGAYVALAKPSASDYTTTSAFLGSFADQVLNTNDYVDMLGQDPIRLGCDFGGSLAYTPDSSGTKLAMTGCAFTPGLPVTGTGAVDGSGGISLKATLPGGEVSYTRDSEGAAKVSGACLPARCLVAGG